jgi:hypothetical protein
MLLTSCSSINEADKLNCMVLTPSLRGSANAEGPHVIGRDKYQLKIDLHHCLARFGNSERKRVWSLMDQWTVHRLPTSLILAVHVKSQTGNWV